MKKALLTLLIFLLSTETFAFEMANQKALDISIINLITSPEKYHQKCIRVIGVSCIEFEGNALYLSKDDYKFNVDKNAVWISFNLNVLNTTEEELEKWNGKYVLIEGIFDMNDNRHGDLFSGSINNVTEISNFCVNWECYNLPMYSRGDWI